MGEVAIEEFTKALAQKVDPKEIRGVCYISKEPKEDFIQLNKQLEDEGKKVYANPRNLAAGTIRQENRQNHRWSRARKRC